jgi:replication-associated recombination protein RarA
VETLLIRSKAFSVRLLFIKQFFLKLLTNKNSSILFWPPAMLKSTLWTLMAGLLFTMLAMLRENSIKKRKLIKKLKKKAGSRKKVWMP